MESENFFKHWKTKCIAPVSCINAIQKNKWEQVKNHFTVYSDIRLLR